MTDQLTTILGSFENRTDPFTELSVSDALSPLVSEYRSRGELRPTALQAECIAFDLMPDYHSEDDSWSSYYGPLMVRTSQDGKRIEWPSLDNITSDIVDCWEARANSTQHPLLRCRYSDLVWEFGFRVRSKKPSVKLAWNLIDSTVELVNSRKLVDGFEAERLLSRALTIAISLNDKDRANKLKALIIGLADLIDDPAEKRHASLFAFDQLVDNPKSQLSAEEEKKLIDDVEGRLLGYAGGCDGQGQRDHWGAEVLATRLAKHYRRLNKLDDVRRVLTLYGRTAEAAAKDAPAIAATTWLRQVHDLYHEFGLMEEAESVLIELQARSKGIEQELRPVSVSTTIPADEMEQVISDMLGDNLSQALRRLAINSVTSIDQAKDLVKTISKESITMSIFQQQLLGNDGRVVAQVGTILDDPEGHAIVQLAKNMRFESQVLRPIIERMIETYQPTVAEIVDFLQQSPLFPSERNQTVSSGIKAYLNEDWVAAIHILTPQVEGSLRELLRLCGRPLMRPHRNGGMVLKNEDEILRDEAVTKSLSERVVIYLRTLLCDQRGWNIRNELSHGISDDQHFNWMVGDRVFLALVLLGLLRPSNDKPESPEVAP